MDILRSDMAKDIRTADPRRKEDLHGEEDLRKEKDLRRGKDLRRKEDRRMEVDLRKCPREENVRNRPNANNNQPF